MSFLDILIKNMDSQVADLATQSSTHKPNTGFIKSLYTKKVNDDTTEKEAVATYSEPISKLTPQREHLTDYGFEQAGLAGGNLENFVSHLELIKNGHFLDADHKQNNKRDEILALINQIEEEKSTLNQYQIDITQLEKGELELCKKNKIRLEDEIDELKTSQAKSEEESEFSLFSVIQFSVFGLVFLIGGMFLYACMTNLVFFNTLNINAITADNVGSMMSLFARVNFTNIFSSVVSIMLAAVILFGATYLESQNKWWLIGVLIFDFIMAFVIENQVADIKTAMGLEVNMQDLAFEGLTIAIFSFFGYYGFAKSIAKLKAELEKKNPHKGLKIKVETLKNRITQIDIEIVAVESKISEIKKKVTAIETAIKKIENRIEYLHSNVEDVLKSLDSFTTGWLNYLSARKVPQEQILNTRKVYTQFLSNKSTDANSNTEQLIEK
ncbi:MAG: hypothetical protein RLZZ175_2553 [Bacteroidota bacterium]|jgi:CII-binding regulator of phage lambda lysogenization HflD/general stress protein CsbA